MLFGGKAVSQFKYWFPPDMACKGHGNCFLRCVIGRSECAYNAIAPSGRLDAEYLGGRYPGLKQALQGGLEWSVIHYEVFERWPL